eukprot:gnl/Dysnectes_brevis/5430_a7803_448.p1 GENE.gnl/Dysnectes_brevis/5430_a7803_448~~gnl/Dysnectes_brevis/5430_a7803_448.p1  ORF type:complete len:294 (+),score=93.14 gnl/Dysnectes_brevis/5430_a7803_448:12-893(+)
METPTSSCDDYSYMSDSDPLSDMSCSYSDQFFSSSNGDLDDYKQLSPRFHSTSDRKKILFPTTSKKQTETIPKPSPKPTPKVHPKVDPKVHRIPPTCTDADITFELYRMSELAFSEYVASIISTLLSVGYPPFRPTNDPPNGFGAEPAISLRLWVYRLMTVGELPRETVLSSVVIILQLLRQVDGTISRSNTYRLLLTAAMISSKMQEDTVFSNRSWTRIADSHYPLHILNYMELELLTTLRFEVNVTRSQFLALLSATYSRVEGTGLPGPIAASWREDYLRYEQDIGAGGDP